MKKILLTALCLTSPILAFAAPGDMSFGVGLGQMKTTSTKSNDTIPPNINTIEGSFDYGILDNLDVQADLGMGMKTVTTRSVDFKLKDYMGLYLKPKVELSKVSLYALLGYSSATLSASVTDFKSNAFSYGVGASYPVMNNLNLYADWKNIYNKKEYQSTWKVEGFTAGVAYKF